MGSGRARPNRILALKHLDLCPAQIGEPLDGDLPADQMRGILRKRQAEVSGRVKWKKDIPDSDHVKVRKLPAVEEIACTVHKGSYDSMAEAYNRLMTWIEANGYRVCGPSREVYIKGPGLLTKPANYVTELQVPVEKA